MQYSSIREKFASKVFRAPFIPRKFERFAGNERSVADKVADGNTTLAKIKCKPSVNKA